MSSRFALIQKVIADKGIPSFRYKQIVDGITSGRCSHYTQFSHIPQSLREDLVKTLGTDRVMRLEPCSVAESTQANKVLFKLHDDHKIEAVHMTFKDPSNGKESYSSICISSQVGCALQCDFCATGAVGFKRQLSVDEITDQILYFKTKNLPVDTISFMGMGEPLMNPKIFEALRVLTDEKIYNLSQRRISVSTVGIIPALEKLSKEFPSINVAFSLHSPFEEQRDILVPANKNYPLPHVMRALEKHALTNNKKVFMAYLVLDGFNDTKEHVEAIADLLSQVDSKVRHLFHVNLLRYNPAEGIDKYEKTTEPNVRSFMEALSAKNIPVTIRRSFGVDIDAACGQLYARYQKKIAKPPREPSRTQAAPPPPASSTFRQQSAVQ